MKNSERTKSVQISEDVHNKAKEYCQDKFLKMGKFIETLILREINTNK